MQFCSIPSCEGLQLVVGEVKNPEEAVGCQQRNTLIVQAIIGGVELLQAAEAVL